MHPATKSLVEFRLVTAGASTLTFGYKNMQHNIHAPPGNTNNLALASLILASLFVVLGPIGSIAGVICGRMALANSKSNGVTEGDRMAKAGMLIGWIGIAIFVIGLLLVAPFLWNFYIQFRTMQNQ